jgi:hypothetical protein
MQFPVQWYYRRLYCFKNDNSSKHNQSSKIVVFRFAWVEHNVWLLLLELDCTKCLGFSNILAGLAGDLGAF